MKIMMCEIKSHDYTLISNISSDFMKIIPITLGIIQKKEILGYITFNNWLATKATKNKKLIINTSFLYLIMSHWNIQRY